MNCDSVWVGQMKAALVQVEVLATLELSEQWNLT
jgi:hypothetical protein